MTTSYCHIVYSHTTIPISKTGRGKHCNILQQNTASTAYCDSFCQWTKWTKYLPNVFQQLFWAVESSMAVCHRFLTQCIDTNVIILTLVLFKLVALYDLHGFTPSYLCTLLVTTVSWSQMSFRFYRRQQLSYLGRSFVLETEARRDNRLHWPWLLDRRISNRVVQICRAMSVKHSTYPLLCGVHWTSEWKLFYSDYLRQRRTREFPFSYGPCWNVLLLLRASHSNVMK